MINIASEQTDPEKLTREHETEDDVSWIWMQSDEEERTDLYGI